MKKNLLLLCAFLNFVIAFGQKLETLNLDFEKSTKSQPTDWNTFGNSSYTTALDSTIFQSGTKSAMISYNGNSPDYKAWAYEIPAKYQGKKIKLTGYLKTENVTDGYAGLWIRIDPNVSFENMSKRGITGTTDWKKYEITVDYSPEATKIAIGGILEGKGKMWIDNLEITIDGKPLNKATLKVLLPAEKDTAFDNGSKIDASMLSSIKLEDLKNLGLIWGFLKYYHPNIIAGKYNWDYELFRIIPKLSAAKTSSEKDKLLTSWINSFGLLKIGSKSPKEKGELKMEADLEWITKSKFSPELTTALNNVRYAKRNGKQFYVDQAKNGNPEFLHENPYGNLKYPDAGFQLLSLYRYWNVIQYFFPYKYLIEEDWKEVLKEFIPKFTKAPDALAYKLAALEIIGRIHDTHANIWNSHKALNEYKGVNIAPIEITFAENKAVVTGFYNETGIASGLQKGDVISHINDKLTDPIVKERMKYTPASNNPTKMRDIATQLLRTNDSVITVSYVRKGVLDYKKLKTVPFYKINSQKKFQSSDTCFRFISPKIGYLYLGSIKTNYLENIMKSVENTDGLIIDLRCYPSEFMVFRMARYLKPEQSAFVKFSSMSLSTPGNFSFMKSVENGGSNEKYYKGKIVILVNELTQSQAEYTAMALRTAPNTTVIGSTTAGADGDVSSFTLPGNISTMISGIGVYYPDGTETQRIGIVPDIEIKPTVAGIRDGKDEVLEKAIEFLNKK